LAVCRRWFRHSWSLLCLWRQLDYKPVKLDSSGITLSQPPHPGPLSFSLGHFKTDCFRCAYSSSKLLYVSNGKFSI
jgi:hypothetical protein